MRALAAACVALAGCTGSLPPPAPDAPAPAPSVAAPSIPIRVVKPAGNGPFAAIVMLHGCGGVDRGTQRHQARWASVLRDEGYVVLIPDSFTTRGHEGGVCTNPSPTRMEVGPGRRAEDAFTALAYARSLPYVDGARVGLMGHSHGGATTLAAMWQQRPAASPYAAAIAFYPSCGVRYGDWRGAAQSGTYKPVAPLLILTGDKDDWTPAAPCAVLAQRSGDAGHPVAIKVYPGAHHAFDGPSPLRYVAERMNANAAGGRGATTGGNPEAWTDSIREVKAFFARHLGRSPG